MGQNTEMRRLRGFGDTSFAFQGGGDLGATQGPPLPEAHFVLDLQGESERRWRVQEFTAIEALSSLYECVLDIASEDFADNPDLLLGRYALLQVHREPVVRRFYGVVRRVEQRGTTAGGRLARLTLVPSLWALSQRSDARVFQEMTAVEVAQAVLQAAGLYAGMLQIVLTQELPRREYIVQYRETDLAFFERLLESEGVTYFFRHDLDGTEALVLTDSLHAWAAVPTMDGGPIPVAGPEMVTHALEAVRNLSWQREQRATRLSVRDYDFTRPDLRIEGVVPRRGEDTRALFVPDPAVTLSQFDGATYTRENALDQAQMRLDAELAPGAHGQGEGLVSGMMPGLTFALSLAGGHVPDEHYAVTRVEHFGNAQEELLLASEREALRDQRYHNRFHCVLRSAPWRPQRKTPHPVIAGVQTATVTGPPGEEIHTDLHGRVRVRFHWDRHTPRDAQSSCWLRVMQGPWAGGGWGFQFLPRVGMEVAVTFLEGDPDRPVILGALFNGQNIPGYELPAGRTRSGIRTQSVGAVGYNELSFEDAAGAERVHVHAQRDLDEMVRNDRTVRVGRDQITEVSGDIRLTGARDARATVTAGVALHADNVSLSTDHDHRIVIGRDRFDHVERTRFDTVSGAHHHNVEGDRLTHVDGYLTDFVGKDREVTVQGDDLVAVWGDQRVSVKGDLRNHVAGDALTAAEGEVALESRAGIRVRAATTLTLSCGQSMIEMTRDSIVLRAPTIRLEASDAIALDAGRSSLELDGGDAQLRSSRSVEVQSDAVRLRAKNAHGTWGREGIALEAKKAVGLVGKGATVVLDGTATVKGSQVKLLSDSGDARFQSRIGVAAPGEEIHVLATRLLSPGGVALAEELVQLVDPSTDEPFGPPVRSDAQGEIRVEVPHPGPWDLRVLHDDWEEPDQPDDHEAETELHVQFVDHEGRPLEDLAVTVRGATECEARSDADGVVHLPVAPGPYTLEVAETEFSLAQVFAAHATQALDRTRRDAQSYVFVIEPDDPELGDEAREHRTALHDHDAEEG